MHTQYSTNKGVNRCIKKDWSSINENSRLAALLKMHAVEAAQRCLVRISSVKRETPGFLAVFCGTISATMVRRIPTFPFTSPAKARANIATARLVENP